MNDILSKDVVKEWGLGTLPPEKQGEIVDRIGRILYQALLVQALDILSEKEQLEFDLLLEEDTTTVDDVLTFLKSKIPTFDQLVEDERKKLKEDLLVPTA